VKQLKGDAREFINRSKHRRCISSVPQLNGNSIEFSLSTRTRRVIKSPQAKSLQGRGKDTGEKCGMPIGKYVAKRRIWRRII